MMSAQELEKRTKVIDNFDKLDKYNTIKFLKTELKTYSSHNYTSEQNYIHRCVRFIEESDEYRFRGGRPLNYVIGDRLCLKYLNFYTNFGLMKNDLINGKLADIDGKTFDLDLILQESIWFLEYTEKILIAAHEVHNNILIKKQIEGESILDNNMCSRCDDTSCIIKKRKLDNNNYVYYCPSKCLRILHYMSSRNREFLLDSMSLNTTVPFAEFVWLGEFFEAKDGN